MRKATREERRRRLDLWRIVKHTSEPAVSLGTLNAQATHGLDVYIVVRRLRTGGVSNVTRSPMTSLLM